MRKKNKQRPRGRPFSKGYDPRRHVLSAFERKKGFVQATRAVKMPSQIRAWLRNKLRRLLREKNAKEYARYAEENHKKSG